MQKRHRRRPHPVFPVLAALTVGAAGVLVWSWWTGRLDHALASVALIPVWLLVGVRYGEGLRLEAIQDREHSRRAWIVERGIFPALWVVWGSALLVRLLLIWSGR